MKSLFYFLSCCLVFILGFGIQAFAKSGVARDDYWLVLSIVGALIVIAGFLYLFDFLRKKIKEHKHPAP